MALRAQDAGERLPLLIIGAGPFGLAMSAYARRYEIEHVIVGRTMGFWRENMPHGMLLRSGCNWHFDPFDEDTIEHYLATKGLSTDDAEPLSRELYLDYCDWFCHRNGIEALPGRVERLDHRDEGSSFFEAVLEDGGTVAARNVVLAVGFRYFKHVPESFSAWLPAQRYAHTCDLVELASLRGKRVLIIGGRQSAFEWAALIREQGATSVALSYRHVTPAFATADWSWVDPIAASMAEDPGWFRRLTVEEREKLSQRFWAEGRLKLEPWLAARVTDRSVRLFPNTGVTFCREGQGEVEATLSDGTTLAVDSIVLATGYKVDMGRIPFLANGNILPRLENRNGYPVLDEQFQSTLPGLFFTSMCAVQDFGPFFAFTVAVRASARVIGAATSAREGSQSQTLCSSPVG
jgi:FAD-dependent urate hydroxylase